MKNTLIVLVALAMIAGFAQADMIVSVANGHTDPLLDPGDGWIDSNGGANSGQALIFGVVPDATNVRSGIAVVKLPTLTGGSTILTANLDLGLYQSNMTAEWNVDLYALYTINTPILTAADHYHGANDAGATKLQDNFVSFLAASPWQPPVGTYSTDTTGDANLTAWLQTQYIGTAPNAAYAVFRVSMDAIPSATWNIDRFSDSMGNGGQIQPTLTIETVPEPATIGLLGLAGLGAMIARRLRIG